jgi:hypothetical protein
LKYVKWTYLNKNNGKSYCKGCNKLRTTAPSIDCPSGYHRSFYERELKRKREKWAINNGSLEWKKKRHEWNKKYREKLRMEAVLKYGGKCSCCGYNVIDKHIRGFPFLEIDHIAGGGSKHQKELHGSIYFWLRRNNYPAGFRVLCKPCNNGMEANESICELHKWQAEEETKY